MLKLTVNTSVLTIANAMRVGQAFATGGGLSSRTEFAGKGQLSLFDDAELDELHESKYVVYSYDTPIAWIKPGGGWVKNMTFYSNTTSKHQHKIFDAIRELS